MVALTTKHRQHVAALAHDLAAKGTVLEHELPVRLPVVVAGGERRGVFVPDVGASCHTSRFDRAPASPTDAGQMSSEGGR